MASFAYAATVSGPAPNFTALARRQDVSLADLKGQVVMVNFWATWCGPCRKEMPHLEALHQRYSSLGFTLLGVNVENDPAAREVARDNGLVTFPILLDSKNQVSKLYKVNTMPSTVLVGRDGTMRYIHHGYEPGRGRISDSGSRATEE